MGEASFGKYRLIAELGHGGMADVFLAVMAGPVGSGFSKLTVIKRLRQNLAEEPEFVEMLVDEARISARLNHPNVVQTNEVGSVGAQYFLAMEYLDGQPLHRIQHRAVQYAQKAAQANREALAVDVSSGAPPSSVLLPTDPFPKECQYLVLVDTLAGLHHAHELADYDGSSLQIVHRDVTPHNVFVTYEGQVKVVDFGIAKAVGRASETRQGVVKGKVRYMAPEQAIGQPVDRRADIFSVGVMLWEAATGRRLWKDMDDLNIVQALVGGNVKCSPRSFDPTVPEEIDRMCVKALAHRREERYATAEEFRLDLEQYLADSGNLVSARRKLGASVSGLFDDKRTEIKAVIEKQLQALMRQVSTDLKPVQIALEQSSGLLPAMSSSAAAAVTTRDPAEEGPTSITDAATEFYTGSTDKKRAVTLRSRLPVIAAGVAAAVAIAVIAFAKISSPTAEVRPASSAPVTETTSADVNIKVRVAPATAHISIDGASVPTPYEARLARDMHDHLLRVEAPGFEPHVQNVRFDSDVTLVVTLTKPAPSASAALTAPPPPPPPTAARWVPPVTPPKAPTSAVPTSPPTTPTVPVTAPPPSSGPHKGNGPKPEIDKGDPWGTGK
jgi:eukaryotic-like serine/threonine-protein kinase